jgi:hypothetical protein
MTLIEQNILSAISIGLIIAVMASIKNSQLKATIYSLPIPITIAIIATGVKVNITNVVGLFLITLFLWFVWFLHERGLNISASDVIAAVCYVIVGYAGVKYVKLSFYTGVSVYLVTWLTFILVYRNRVVPERKRTNSKIKPATKGVVVTLLAYVLFSLKNYLAGIIVTFPFSGVFAVIESKHMLETLAGVFTRNSIAILMMFVTIHALVGTNVGVKLIAGWAVYLVVLNLAIKLAPLKKKP